MEMTIKKRAKTNYIKTSLPLKCGYKIESKYTLISFKP